MGIESGKGRRDREGGELQAMEWGKDRRGNDWGKKRIAGSGHYAVGCQGNVWRNGAFYLKAKDREAGKRTIEWLVEMQRLQDQDNRTTGNRE